MEPIAKHNDLGHPLCANLRAGDWMMHYTVNRLQQYPRLGLVRAWLKVSKFSTVNMLIVGRSVLRA